MLTIAGRKYAKNNSEMTNSLFQSGGTCSGYYRSGRHGILLRNLQGKPFAFIANQGGSQWFVTAGIGDNGKTVYMQGFGDYTARELGIDHLSYSEQHEVARKAIQDVAATVGRGRAASEYGNDEIRWPDGLQHY
jgi:hypothetical protein